MKQSYAVRTVLKHYPNLDPRQVKARLRSSTYLNVKKKYMYFAVPKAACTSMKALLNAIEGPTNLEYFAGHSRETRREMFIHDRFNVALPSLVDVDDKTQRWVLESPDVLRMTVVRNPYMRLVSAWQNKVLLCEPSYEPVYQRIKGHLPEVGRKSLVSFEEFVEYIASTCNLHTCDPHWRLQVDHIFFRAMKFSYVGKMENMAEVLTTLQRQLNLSSLPSLNRSNSSLYKCTPSIPEELWEKIYTLYLDDFENLHYEKDSNPAPHEAAQRGIPEGEYINEILERHMVMNLLYNRCAQLKDKVDRVERFHLLAIVNTCMIPVRLLRKALGFCQCWLAGHAVSRVGIDQQDRSSQQLVKS